MKSGGILAGGFSGIIRRLMLTLIMIWEINVKNLLGGLMNRIIVSLAALTLFVSLNVSIFAQAGTQKKSFRVQGAVTDLCYSKDGSKIACAYKNIVALYGPEGDLVKRFGVKDGNDIDVIDYGNGVIAAYAYTNPAQIMIWGDDGTLQKKIGAIAKDADETTVNPDIETAKPYRLGFSPDGKYFVITSKTDNFGGVKMRDLATGKAKALKGYEDTSVYGLSFAGDGSGFATISRDEKVILWDAQGAQIKVIETGDPLESSYEGRDVALLAGRTIVVLKATGLSLWSADGKLVKELPEAGDSAPVFVRASKDGSAFAVAFEEGDFAIFGQDGSLKSLVKTDGAVVSGISFSPDGASLAAAVSADYGRGTDIRIYSVR
jgi:WD40 repeat protein